MKSEWLKKDSKLVKDTKATLIYGPYPKDNPEGQYMISFSDTDRKNIWISSFEELIDILKKEIG